MTARRLGRLLVVVVFSSSLRRLFVVVVVPSTRTHGRGHKNRLLMNTIRGAARGSGTYIIVRVSYASAFWRFSNGQRRCIKNENKRTNTTSGCGTAFITVPLPTNTITIFDTFCFFFETFILHLFFISSTNGLLSYECRRTRIRGSLSLSNNPRWNVHVVCNVFRFVFPLPLVSRRVYCSNGKFIRTIALETSGREKKNKRFAKFRYEYRRAYERKI